VSFWGPILGRKWGSAVFVIAGEEVGFDEILFAGSREAKPWKTNYVRFGNNARRGRRCGGRRFGGQPSGGGEG